MDWPCCPGGGTIQVSGNQSTLQGGLTLNDVQVRITNTDRLKLAGDLTNNATIQHHGSIRTAQLRLTQDVAIDGDGEIVFVTNSGDNQIRGSGDPRLTFGENQTRRVPDGGRGRLRVRFENRGTVYVIGWLDVDGDGVLENTTGGRITGDGRIFLTNQKTLTNHGIINPGNSPGSLRFDNANLEFADEGELIIEISPDEHDRIVVEEEVTLGGTLTVNLRDGFTPDPTDSFTIFTADRITGTFDNAPEMITFPGGSFEVDYRTGLVELGQFVVPEPPGGIAACARWGVGVGSATQGFGCSFDSFSRSTRSQDK